MQYEVIADEQGRLHQAPIKRDGATPRAGPPAGTLVPHCYPAHRKVVRRGQFEYPGRQLLCRQPAQMLLDGRAEITVRIRYAKPFVADANGSDFTILPCLNPHPFAAKEDFGPQRPGLGPLRTLGLPQELLLQPRRIPFREAVRLRQ